jgi:hypothetical protein
VEFLLNVGRVCMTRHAFVIMKWLTVCVCVCVCVGLFINTVNINVKQRLSGIA